MSGTSPRYSLVLLVLALGACGQEPPPPKEPPAKTVFDPIIDKKREVPAAVNAAQDQHMQDTRRAIDEAEGAPPPADGAPR